MKSFYISIGVLKHHHLLGDQSLFLFLFDLGIGSGYLMSCGAILTYFLGKQDALFWIDIRCEIFFGGNIYIR